MWPHCHQSPEPLHAAPLSAVNYGWHGREGRRRGNGHQKEEAIMAVCQWKIDFLLLHPFSPAYLTSWRLLCNYPDNDTEYIIIHSHPPLEGSSHNIKVEEEGGESIDRLGRATTSSPASCLHLSLDPPALIKDNVTVDCLRLGPLLPKTPIVVE